MASKIATPVTQGAQNIGGVKSQAADVQFQKFDTNKDMFGAKKGEFASGLGEAVISGGAELRDKAIAEDKRNIVKAETTAIESEAFHKAELGKLVGQEKIDYINNNNLSPGGSTPIQYGTQADAAIGEYSDAMTTVGKQDLENTMRLRKASFGLTMSNESSTAKRAIDAKMMGDRVAAYTEAAVAQVGQPLPPEYASIEKFYEAKEGLIESSVTDIHLGLGRGQSKESQDALIKKQTALMYNAVITEMAAQDDIPGAIALLDREMGKDGSLRGTVEGTALQGKILAQRQEYAGRAAFRDIVKNAKSTDPKDLIPKLIELQAKDATLGASAWSAFATLNKMQSAEKTAKRVDAILAWTKHFIGGGSIATMDRGVIDVISETAAELLSVQSLEGLAKAGVRKTERDKHIAAGGSPNGSTNITADFKRMGDEDPESLAALFKTEASRNQVRALVSADQMADLTIAAGRANDRYSVIKGAAEEPYEALIQKLGYKKGTTKHDDLLVDEELRAKVTAERLAFHQENGRAMKYADLAPIVAQHVLKVKPKDGEYSVYALSELDKDGATNIGTLTLQLDNTSDYKRLSQVYGVSTVDLKKAVDAIHEKMKGLDYFKKVTLADLDSQLGKTRKSFREVDAKDEAMRDASLAAGYNYDFMEWAAKNGANGANLDNDVLLALDQSFKDDPALYAKQYQRWLNGK